MQQVSSEWLKVLGMACAISSVFPLGLSGAYAETTKKSAAKHHSSAQPSFDTVLDKGKFVNPLPGESLSSSSVSFSFSSSSYFRMSAKTLIFDTETKSIMNLTDVNRKLIGDKRQPNDIDDLHQFNKAIKKLSIVNKDPIPKFVHPEIRIISSFLKGIIQNSVDLVENKRLDNMHKINKEKLINDLKEKYDDYCVAKDTNNYLNTKIIEYHKRQKVARAFSKLSPALAQIEYERYMTALFDYDHYLNLVEAAKEKINCYKRSVFEEVAEVYAKSQFQEQSLESKIRRHIGNISESLRKVVEHELTLMRTYRNDISDTRLDLITRKHTLGLISEVS